MTEQAEPTPGPWETSRHKAPWSPNLWIIREHEFPNHPYEGQLEREWGVYPPLGESGPVALVAGGENARLISAAPELLAAAKAALATHSLTESERGLPSLSEVEAMLRAAIAKAEALPTPSDAA